jgi:predicted acylesterase/phospholipase RssA
MNESINVDDGRFISVHQMQLRRMTPSVLASGRSWSISFSGAGHLIVYHLGVAKTLLSYANNDKSRPVIRAVAGSSSGAVVAAAVACFPNEIDDYTDRFLQDRGRALANFEQMLQETKQQQQKPALLGIATTSCTDGSLKLFTFDPQKRKHKRLLRTIQASCAIPRSFHPWDIFSKQELSYPDDDGIEIDGDFYVDGGIASPCPTIQSIPEEDATRIVVSPISGSSTSHWNIRPKDSSFKVPFMCDLTARCGTFRIRPSVQNLQALVASAGAASPQVMNDWHQKGIEDAHLFLEAWKNKGGRQEEIEKSLT